MTKAQSAAYKIFSFLALGAGFFLLRFSYLVVFKDANFGSPGFQGVWVSNLAALPAAILGIVVLIVACILMVKGLGRVNE
jgi:hypothetical protein